MSKGCTDGDITHSGMDATVGELSGGRHPSDIIPGLPTRSLRATTASPATKYECIVGYNIGGRLGLQDIETGAIVLESRDSSDLSAWLHKHGLVRLGPGMWVPEDRAERLFANRRYETNHERRNEAK